METIAIDLDEVVCPDHQPELLPDAQYCLNALKRHFNLEVVTARNPYRREATGVWIATCLPDVFSAVHFNRDYNGQSVSKAEVCLDIGATHLVDNLAEHCEPARQLGITALQFGSEEYPDWRSVLSFFQEKVLTSPIHRV